MNLDAHDELRDSVGLYVLGALTPAESAALEAHVAVCAECAVDVRLLRPTAELLARSLEPGDADPSPHVRARVLRTISSARRARRSYAVAGGSRVIADSGRVRNLLRTSPNSRAERGPAKWPCSPAPPTPSQIELKGQPAAPRASARAFWSRSSGLVVAASDLPPSPDGRTYQLWILTAQEPAQRSISERAGSSNRTPEAGSSRRSTPRRRCQRPWPWPSRWSLRAG